MGSEALYNAITNRFSTEVTVPTGMLIEYPNQEPIDPAPGVKFSRVTILPGDSNRVSLGGGTNVDRTLGVAIIQIFIPKDIGVQSALEFADHVASKFRAVTAAGVRYRTPSVQNIGTTNVSPHFQVNVVCPFQKDELN